MAQFMKVQIRVVLPAGEILTIDVDDNETFEEFQDKCLQLHGLHLDKGYFNFQNIQIDNNVNLAQFINSFNTSDSDCQSEMIVYEIRLQPACENTDINIPIKTESPVSNINGQYGTFLTLNSENEASEVISVLEDSIFDGILTSDSKSADIDLNILKPSICYIGNNTPDVEKDTQTAVDISLFPNNVVDKNDSSNNKTLCNYMDIESKLREIHDTSDELPSDFCRLCAKTIKEYKKISIYDETDSLSEKINLYLPIKTIRGENLPEQICEDCTSQLKGFSDFVQNVLQADKILRLKFITEIDTPKTVEKDEYIKYESNELYETLIKKNSSDSTNDEILKCRFCQETILDADMSLTHSTEFHCNRNGLFICVLCEMGYTNFKLLQEHVETKHKKQFLNRSFNFKCNTCSKRYSTILNLEKHLCIKPKTPQVSLHCEICNESFPSKVRLNFHRQFHLKNARSLFCSECRITFKDEDDYFNHVYFLHDPEQIYVCELCEKTFNLRSAFTNHKKMHLGDKNHKCEVCNKSFVTRQTLQEHEITHMDTKPYQCHLCGKKLTRMSRLRKHLLTHMSDPVANDVFVCKIWKECFQDEKTVEEHKESKHKDLDCIEILHTDRVFRCEFCEKCFSTVDALNSHRMDHRGLTPYTCHICQAKFTTFSRCTTHKTTHAIIDSNKDKFPVVKHFLCEHCGKSYLHWSYLNLHRKLKHSNSQSYKCVDCNSEFNTSWSLNHHRKTIHLEESESIIKSEVIICLDCGKRFSTVKSLQIHQVTQHHIKYGKDFQCVKCGKIFASQMSLDAHIKTHLKEFKCSKCSKCFVHLGGLNNHLKLHQEPHTVCLYCGRKFNSKADCEEHENLHIKSKVICDVCEKSFDTKNQLLEHSQVHDQRPYVCQICGLAFRRPFTLKSHMHRHVKAKHSGSFVLMVDMKDEMEDKKDNTVKEIETMKIPDNTVSDNMENEVPANYIDIGNGNYLQVQGNTINIDGNDYILIDQNSNADNTDNEQFQMIVDEDYTENQLTDVNGLNNTVMLVNDNNQLLFNENVSDQQYILTSDNIVSKPNTTYFIGDQFVTSDQTSSN